MSRVRKSQIQEKSGGDTASCSEHIHESRKAREKPDEFIINIPKKVVEQYGIEHGDEIQWVQNAWDDRPSICPPGIEPERFPPGFGDE